MSIWLELEAGGRKAGAVCAREYRSGDGCPLVVRRSSEDLLVANVFGMLRLLNADRWLRRLLNRAFLTRRFNLIGFGDTSMAFWQRLSPRTLRRAPEGDSEIDVLLRFADCAVYVEAKYEADLSPRTRNDPRRDQLVRLLEVVYDDAICGLWRRQPYVLVVGLSGEPPLVTSYRERDELARQLTHHRVEEASARAALMSRRVGYLSWRTIRDLVAAPLPGLHATERRILDEVARYLDHRIRTSRRALRLPILTEERSP